VHIRSRLRIQGMRLAGNWEERTFNVAGTAAGSLTPNKIALNLEGGGFTGSMSVSFSHAHQDISISTQGIGLSRVAIALTRR